MFQKRETEEWHDSVTICSQNFSLMQKFI